MIRKLIKEDISQCAKIYSEVFTEDTWGCSWSQERAAEYLTDIVQSPKFVGFVSENDGVIEGAIFAVKKVSWNGDEIHVDELIVDKNKQRSGIGKALVDALKEYCKENGIAGLVLYTAEEAPAKKFYEKNGFKVSNGVICMYWV